MNCLNCNAPLAAIDYCTNCGADMSILKRINRISNMNYNEGLDKASVRDLSGAIVCLKRSLRFNKYNIQARNLLGLVYFETGEVVSALSEWVISKNLQNDGNVADYFITKLQSNPNKLNTINQTIRKYNQALTYCYQKSDDMAIIQLKKVLAQNPKFIKGAQLLSLLYIRNGEYERARKVLRKAARIDTTNTMTLRYIHEIDDVTGKFTILDTRRSRKRDKGSEETENGRMQYVSGNEVIIQPTTFHETSIVSTFINLILGFMVGSAVLWFLVIPSKEQNASQTINNTVVEYSDKLSRETAKAAALEKEIENYQSQIEEASQKMEDADQKAESYEAILQAANLYVTADNEEGDVDERAVEAIMKIERDSLEGEAQTLYDNLLAQVNDKLFDAYKLAGYNAYFVNIDYQEAAEQYQKAMDINDEDIDLLLSLGDCYLKLDQIDNAKKVFSRLIELDPDQEYTYGYLFENDNSDNGSENDDNEDDIDDEY